MGGGKKKSKPKAVFALSLSLFKNATEFILFNKTCQPKN